MTPPRLPLVLCLLVAGCHLLHAQPAWLAPSPTPAPPPIDITFDLTQPSTVPDFTAAGGHGYDLGTRPGAEGKPFYFSAVVPEGNYRVEVTLGGASASTVTVRSESRQLQVERAEIPASGSRVESFLVNVRTRQLPTVDRESKDGTLVRTGEREAGYLRWDDRLTLEFNGTHPTVSTIRIQSIEAPTVYLLGDSTVTDQNFEPAASWGQMLPRFLRGVAVANHAESGETMKAFITELRLAKVLRGMKAGDVGIIQFGHNDQKKSRPDTYVEAGTTYKAYLRVFVEEIRRRGATPILVTPVARRFFDEQGRIMNTHGDYPQAVRELAAELKVWLVDLEADTRALYEAWGPANAPLAFNDGGKDATHHNNFGAYEIAKCVIQSLKREGSPLIDRIDPSFQDFDPRKPASPATWSLPPAPLRSDARPAGS